MFNFSQITSVLEVFGVESLFPERFRCLESIIGEQLKKIRHSLADILTLDTAAASATSRLSVVRASMRQGTTKPKKVRLRLNIRMNTGTAFSASFQNVLSLGHTPV